MNKRILIADDYKHIRAMLKDILTENGYEVVGEAANGLMALTKCIELKPDLVTMDITMPGTNGIETIKAVLANSPNIKIIIVSAMIMQEYVLEVLQAGAKDFIGKPFTEERLLQAVESALSTG
ncbi:two-component system, chemotaxis family, response regulator CheY [Desulfotomaculum arcticum]|uniref:Stage 0 sporulation protein A homolog n=1 Tax=Desulfotruncus arcticus DSM 17038 TaxID=1121424 RepID=A0A1I2P2B5_9FIRM|nr:response regulator [Desulfotruncus arcticus]SFG10198.1 two-component system, chemotaxis family, response regulator CheY [Desulfotomaculum arcticum] [Desulfotruncus arcticus DSM 17038]